jgi:hypothetical protein
MGNGNSTGWASSDYAQLLKKFREADAAYQSAPDADKENHFPRRHAALMMVLGTPPRMAGEIAELMGIALEELTRHLMISGPVPEAVVGALTNCLRAIEDVDQAPSIRGEERSIELAATEAAPSDTVMELDCEIGKLDKLAGLLAYLAKSSHGREEEAVFLAVRNGAEAIRDALSSAVDELMLVSPSTRRQATTRR